MLATISPAYDNYEETISTLRYADQAKKIVNHAVINEDEPGTIIRELRNEIDLLRKELADAKAEKSAEKLNAEINENEKLMQTITKDWQERIAETDKISKVTNKFFFSFYSEVFISHRNVMNYSKKVAYLFVVLVLVLKKIDCISLI
jgi:hypothetical protein